MLTDTHAHVNFAAFKEDAEGVVRRALSEGVSVVNVGTQADTSRQAVAMAEKFEKDVYAVVGIHPVHTYSQELDEEETHFKTREEKFNYEEYKKLASRPKVVGIGECGLDYFRLPEAGDLSAVKKPQAEAFIEQLKLAKELNKTLVIHSRSSKGTDNACLDILDILKNPHLWNRSERSEESLKSDLPRFVLHSYTGSWEVLDQFLALGGYVSFNGIITFDKTGNMEKLVKNTPNDRFVLETDCPYLTPVPMRGKRNEPSYVKFVAEKAAQIKNLSVDEIEKITTQNAKKLFSI